MQLASSKPLLIFALPMALALASMVSTPALEAPRMRSSVPLSQKIVHFATQIAQIPSIKTWMSRTCRSRKHLGIFRLDLQIWNRISAPSPNVRARSSHVRTQHQMYPVRQDPGLRSNKLTAPQPQGLLAQDRLLITETQDALLNGRKVPSYNDSRVNGTKWISALCEMSNIPADKLVTTHCKAGSMSVMIVFETRANCPDIVVRFKDDGIPHALDSTFCCTNTSITVRQSRSLEDREESWLTSSKLSHQMEMRKVLSSSQRSTLNHLSSALKIGETAVGNRCSNLLLLEVDKHVPSFHLICLFLIFRLRCCNGFFSS